MSFMIQGRYKKRKLYNNIYEYTCPEGSHFESYGVNYGRVIYGGETIQNPYIIKIERNEEMDNTNTFNTDNSNEDDGRTH